MSRFTRFSCISPMALYLEEERRALRTALLLLLLLPAGALATLLFPAAEPVAVGAGESDFRGIAVAEAEASPAPAQESAVLPLPASPPVELHPEICCAAELPSFTPPAPDWEAAEGDFIAEDLLVLEMPESLAAPPAAAPREAGGAGSSAAAQGELLAARYRSTPPPPYPPALLRRRAEGRVGLRVVVDAEGVPQSVEVSSTSGYAAFDRCAREWVLAHWRFHPARRGGVAVCSVVHSQVDFVLR